MYGKKFNFLKILLTLLEASKKFKEFRLKFY